MSDRTIGTNAPGRVTPDDRCVACDGPLRLLGIERFRTGGTSGGSKLLFGELAELGEETLALEVRVCDRCRRLDLRIPAAEGGTDPGAASAAEPAAPGEAPSGATDGGHGAAAAALVPPDPISDAAPAPADEGYSPGMKAGATLLTIFAPFIALIAALVMLGSEQGPARRAFLRTWAWISAGLLALALIVAITVIASVAGSTHNVDPSGECIGGPMIGEPGISLGGGRYRFPCAGGGSTVVNLGGSAPPAP